MPSGHQIAWTPKQDEIIRGCWAHNKIGVHAAKRAAEIFGCCYESVLRRATQLGLVYAPQRFRWTQAELDVVEKNAHLALDTIQKKLRDVSPPGVKRTRPAIAAVIFGQHLRKNLDGLGHPQLARALGVSVWKVGQWREKGWLDGERLPSIREECGYQENTNEEFRHWHYTNEAIVRFLFVHSSEIDLRKVDQLWFLTLIEPYVNLSTAPRGQKAVNQARIEFLERALAEQEKQILLWTKGRTAVLKDVCPTCGRRAPGRPRLGEARSRRTSSSTDRNHGQTPSGSVLDSATVERIRNKALRRGTSVRSAEADGNGRNSMPNGKGSGRLRSGNKPETSRIGSLSSGCAGGPSAKRPTTLYLNATETPVPFGFSGADSENPPMEQA